MDSIADWLASITWPLVSRALGALGMGTVTYVGVNGAISGAFQAAKDAFSGLAADVFSLLAMAGFFDFMAITSGGVISGISWLVLKRFALNTSGSGGGGAAT